MNQSVILFDGICNLCNNSVQFIIKRDHKERYQFASLQSDYGISIKENFGLPGDYTESIILLKDEKLYFRSDAALMISKDLNFPWSVLHAFIVLPKFLRDPVYNFIARNRYKWFGKKDQCTLAMPGWEKRFIK